MALTRDEVASIEMDARAFALTLRRAAEENSAGRTETFATSMFKYYSTELDARRAEANVRFMGTQGVGWEGDAFSAEELQTTRLVAVRQGTDDRGRQFRSAAQHRRKTRARITRLMFDFHPSGFAGQYIRLRRNQRKKGEADEC